MIGLLRYDFWRATSEVQAAFKLLDFAAVQNSACLPSKVAQAVNLGYEHTVLR